MSDDKIVAVDTGMVFHPTREDWEKELERREQWKQATDPMLELALREALVLYEFDPENPKIKKNIELVVGALILRALDEAGLMPVV